MEEIEFSAALPDIQSAISIGNGCRIKLDVPETDIAAVMRLAAFGRSKVLRVTVEFDPSAAASPVDAS